MTHIAVLVAHVLNDTRLRAHDATVDTELSDLALRVLALDGQITVAARLKQMQAVLWRETGHDSCTSERMFERKTKTGGRC